jgi:hypothetical protein
LLCDRAICAVTRHSRPTSPSCGIVAVIATCIFLPLEAYELTEKVTAFRLGAFVINVAAVVWLLWSKRLFGLNGGGAAYRAEHSAENLLTVERTAHESDQSA